MAKMAQATAVTGLQHQNNPAARYTVADLQRLITDFMAVINREQNSIVDPNECTFVDGTTAGKIKILGGTEAIPVAFRVNGELLSKAPADDFWNLAAQTDTPALEYAAFWLLVSDAGAASIQRATANAASAVAAKAVLLADGEPPADKAVFGVFVAGPETDFSADAIVAKAGATMEYGIPADLRYVPTVNGLST